MSFFAVKNQIIFCTRAQEHVTVLNILVTYTKAHKKISLTQFSKKKIFSELEDITSDQNLVKTGIYSAISKCILTYFDLREH